MSIATARVAQTPTSALVSWAVASAQAVTLRVEEKFGEHNFRVLSEMRILAKIRVVILDFGRVSRFFSEIWREIRF